MTTRFLTGKRVIMHCCISLGYLEERAKLGKLDFEGATPTQALQEIAKARAKGFLYWPACDNVGPDGHCAGHEEAK